jgi:hypothetical protein
MKINEKRKNATTSTNINDEQSTSILSLIEKRRYKLMFENYKTVEINYNTLVINNLLCNGKNHIVAIFKEHLIDDDNSEFLRRFYTERESSIRIKKVAKYYFETSVIFPNYTPLNEAKYIYKNIMKKQKVIDKQQELEEEIEENKKRKIKISKERPGNKKKQKKENKLVFQEIFNNLEFDPAFYQDDESNKYSIEDIYINFEEPKNMGNSYYSNIIFRAKKFKRNSNNLFIFDWDNTLLPTYYLAQENILNERELPLEYLSIFSLLEDCIYKLLKISIDKGEVYIITNSSIGWVEYSANKYFPSLVKLLKYINIISAKDEFQNIFPDNKKIWKQQAFLSLKEKIILNRINNIICFGDSYTIFPNIQLFNKKFNIL